MRRALSWAMVDEKGGAMSSFGRMVAVLVLAVLVTSAMVLLITYRMMGEMGPGEVNKTAGPSCFWKRLPRPSL